MKHFKRLTRYNIEPFENYSMITKYNRFGVKVAAEQTFDSSNYYILCYTKSTFTNCPYHNFHNFYVKINFVN